MLILGERNWTGFGALDNLEMESFWYPSRCHKKQLGFQTF